MTPVQAKMIQNYPKEKPLKIKNPPKNSNKKQILKKTKKTKKNQCPKKMKKSIKTIQMILSQYKNNRIFKITSMKRLMMIMRNMKISEKNSKTKS